MLGDADDNEEEVYVVIALVKSMQLRIKQETRLALIIALKEPLGPNYLKSFHDSFRLQDMFLNTERLQLQAELSTMTYIDLEGLDRMKYFQLET